MTNNTAARYNDVARLVAQDIRRYGYDDVNDVTPEVVRTFINGYVDDYRGKPDPVIVRWYNTTQRGFVRVARLVRTAYIDLYGEPSTTPRLDRVFAD